MAGNGAAPANAAAAWSAETVEGPGGEKYVISARLRRCSALEDAVVELTMLVWFGCAGALPHRQVCSAENLRCRFCAASTWSGAAQGGVHAARRAPVRAVCRCGVGEQGRPDLPAGAHRLLLPAARQRAAAAALVLLALFCTTCPGAAARGALACHVAINLCWAAQLWPAYRTFGLWWLWRRYFGCRLVRACALLAGRVVHDGAPFSRPAALHAGHTGQAIP